MKTQEIDGIPISFITEIRQALGDLLGDEEWAVATPQQIVEAGLASWDTVEEAVSWALENSITVDFVLRRGYFA